VHCNAPAGGLKVRRWFSWTDASEAKRGLANLIPFVRVGRAFTSLFDWLWALPTFRRLSVDVPTCRRCRTRARIGRFVSWAALLGGVAGAAWFTSTLARIWSPFAGVLIAVVARRGTRITAVHVGLTHVTLDGVCPQFMADLPRPDVEEAKRRRAAQSPHVRPMNHPPLILAIGEILWDRLPTGRQMGGAPANFAYHAGQLGADARIVSAVGDDADGREIIGRLQSLGLDASLVAVDPIHPTGTVTVALDAGQPTYTIHEDVAWDFIRVTPGVLELARQADCVCFGTLAQRGSASREAIRAVLAAARPGGLRILDINFRQHYYDAEVVDRSLSAATVLKINDHELPLLVTLLGAGPAPASLFERYPELRLVALTRGASGSKLFARDGETSDHPGFSAKVADTIGAGDAFTAAMAVELMGGRTLVKVNDAANVLAAYVCARAGATPALEKWFFEFYESRIRGV
jgi:fructokinase